MTKDTRLVEFSSIELFAGAGLLSHAFKTAGARALLAVEADVRARASFSTNVGSESLAEDVRVVPQGLKCDLLVGGPPCQGFSTLGKLDALDDRNKLSLLMVDWAKATSPSVVVIENVPPFLKSTYWKRIKAAMKRLGYESSEWVLNAADFGAPQSRTRAFAILSKIGLPAIPVPTVSEPVTVRQAFEGLPFEQCAQLQHVAPAPSALALARFQKVPEGGDKRDVMRNAPELCPPSWQKMGVQAVDVWGRMRMDRPSNTLRCSFLNPSKGRYIHPTEDRVITLREGARLQGIPDSWRFSGDMTSVARQIGNGVPIALGRAVADQVAKLFLSAAHPKSI